MLNRRIWDGLRVSLAIAGTVFAMNPGATARAVVPAVTGQPRVVEAEIRGTINPASAHYLEQAIDRADRENADALIVELDTPGGLLSSVRKMSQAIDRSSVPVVVYVYPAGASATSAGAILMLASHVAAMAPGTAIGAAHPVGSGGGDIKGVMGEKVLNDTAAFARGLAEIRGRPEKIAEQIVTQSRSFTADEAIKVHLIEIEARGPSELLSQLNGRQVKTRAGLRTIRTTDAIHEKFEMSFGQKLLNWLSNPNLTAILFSLGAILVYFELSSPGAVFPGVAGAVCFLIALMGTQLLPIQTGALALLLFGVGLLIAEIFIHSFGVLGLGGLLSFVLGLIWLIDPTASSWGVSPAVWAPVAIVLGSFMLMITLAVIRSRRLNREQLVRLGAAGIGGLGGYPGVVESVREGGRQGKVLVRGELWEFESSEELRPGDSIQVLERDGMRIRVRRLESTKEIT